MIRLIHNDEIRGVGIDRETRCTHWHSELDIIAIKFKCCGRWFPCFDCHTAVADHEPQGWAAEERNEPAILCGVCGLQLSISDYFGCDSICPGCGSSFNPGCANHYNLYFEI